MAGDEWTRKAPTAGQACMNGAKQDPSKCGNADAY